MGNTLFENSEGRIYEKYYLRLFNLSYAILKNRMQAEEVMQDTLLKFFDSEERYSNIKERDKWLTKVCVNKSIDQLRKNNTEKRVFAENVSEILEMETTTYHEIDKIDYDIKSFHGVTIKDLRMAIGSLAPGYRLMITLVHFEGFDYEEIAQITGIKESTVRSQYARAKQKLIDILESKKKDKGSMVGQVSGMPVLR